MDPTKQNLNQPASVIENSLDMDAGYYVSGQGIQYPNMNTSLNTSIYADDVITITSNDTISLNGLYTTTSPIYPPPHWANPSSKISLTGDQADIEINGKSLLQTLVEIEKKLNILTPNPQLESQWEELKMLGDQYRKLEQHIKEKQETWNKLASVPPPPPPENW